MDLDTIFPVWLQSFLFTERQREVGFRRDVEGVPCVRYDFEWQGQKVLSDNFFVRGRAPHTVVPLIQSANPAPDHILRVVEDQPGLRTAYESLGYRVDFVETLMARPLTNLPPLAERHEVMLVRGREHIHLVNYMDSPNDIAARPDDLDNPAIRFYIIRWEGHTVCRARSASHNEAVAWVSHVFTLESQRRQGMAQAVMTRLLRDDAAAGHSFSTLLATQEGYPLYQYLGYQDIATIINFVPTP
jgi:hypothetical protein